MPGPPADPEPETGAGPFPEVLEGLEEAGVEGDSVWYSYAVLRVVPRVERGECINAGVILFARTRRFLQAAIELDEKRLLALAPDLDVAELRTQLAAIQAICAGRPEGGPLAALPPSERFHQLTAPRSTVIQPGPVHTGWCTDPAATLARLAEELVRPV